MKKNYFLKSMGLNNLIRGFLIDWQKMLGNIVIWFF